MSLSKTDITKKRRLSLQGAKVETSPRAETSSQRKEPPYTIEEKTLRDLLQLRPVDGEEIYNQLVDTFGLVSEITGKKIRVRKDVPGEKVEIKATPKKRTLQDIATELLQPRHTYTREEIIDQFKAIYRIEDKRAERGLIALLEAGLIEVASGDIYYLSGSTPF